MENNRDLEIKRKEALAIIKEWVRLETENIQTDSKYNLMPATKKKLSLSRCDE